MAGRIAAIADEACACFEKAAKEYGTVPHLGRSIADRAKGELSEILSLAVVQCAPEIAGKDVGGKSFKLSDSLGQVVASTFSGNWCPPCRAMYPKDRELVERHEGQPFALLSVNTDETRDGLRKSIVEGEITWKCWWDGGVDDPICNQWNVMTFPSVYVLDAAGIIRFKGIEGQKLDEAVGGLLGEWKRSMRCPKARSYQSAGVTA